MSMLDKMRERQGLAPVKAPKSKPPKVVKAPAPPSVPKPKPPEVRKVPHRLPDDATFHLRYEAATETWHGVLRIGDESLYSTARAVFTLMDRLDSAYRKKIAAAAQGESK